MRLTRRDAADRREKLAGDEIPDIEISTSVRARELRFKSAPETDVWFEGEPAHDSSSETERENLPDEVVPGETYRDVEVRWRARARIVHPADRED